MSLTALTNVPRPWVRTGFLARAVIYWRRSGSKYSIQSRYSLKAREISKFAYSLLSRSFRPVINPVVSIKCRNHWIGKRISSSLKQNFASHLGPFHDNVINIASNSELICFYKWDTKITVGTKMGISYSSTLFKAFSCSRKVYNFTRPEKNSLSCWF